MREISEQDIQFAKQIAVHFSLGIIKLEEKVDRGIAQPVTILEEQIQLGWDQLAFFCLKHGVKPPSHLQDLVNWLHTPVQTWPEIGDVFGAADLSGSLLVFGGSSELCRELLLDWGDVSDPQLELQDLPFKHILKYCNEKNLPDQYTSARQHLVWNPYLAYGAVTISASTTWERSVQRWLSNCYEPIPQPCKRIIDGQEHVALCPRCGWPLTWNSQGEAACYDDLCRQLVKHLNRSEGWTPVYPESMRTTRGIQSFIVGPELGVRQLAALLDDLGIAYELWPLLDSYDLRICFSDEVWAVDLKDKRNPVSAAKDAGAFRGEPQWDKAYYVFPEHRRSKDYMRAFKSAWARPHATEALFLNDFIALIEKKAGNE